MGQDSHDYQPNLCYSSDGGDFCRYAITLRLLIDGIVILQAATKVLFYACQSRGSNEMRSNIFTSIANVIRFSAEGTEMLRKSSSQCSHLKSCAVSLEKYLPSIGGLLRLLGAAGTGINPAYVNANYAFTAGLIPATATVGNCPGSWVKSIDERGSDAIDHQRLTQPRSQRSS